MINVSSSHVCRLLNQARSSPNVISCSVLRHITSSSSGGGNRENYAKLKETPKERFLREREERRAKTLHGFYDITETNDMVEFVGDRVVRKKFKKQLTTPTFSTEFFAALHKKYDISAKGMYRWLKDRQWTLLAKEQVFKAKRHAILGPDLAAAHFVTFRSGKVQFHGSETWWDDDTRLPMKYDERFRLKSVVVDGLKFELVHEGLDNLVNLKYLENLDISHCWRLNDFSFDKLYRMFRNSKYLKTLNVTNCPGFSHRSLAAVHRVPSLRKVVITGTPASEYEFFDLVQVLVQDINPLLELERGENNDELIRLVKSHQETRPPTSDVGTSVDSNKGSS
ncbi:hypothetical protein HDE_11537 [Halotydeus destructor]|nr:hypothetical protein HDE_11537 [Halotydeus destructor]